MISAVVQPFGSAALPLPRVDNPSPSHFRLEAKAEIAFGCSVVVSISSGWLLV